LLSESLQNMCETDIRIVCGTYDKRWRLDRRFACLPEKVTSSDSLGYHNSIKVFKRPGKRTIHLQLFIDDITHDDKVDTGPIIARDGDVYGLSGTECQ
jgi:hypothetical protein